MQRADIFRARPTHLGPVSQRIWTPLDLDPDSRYGPPPPPPRIWTPQQN